MEDEQIVTLLINRDETALKELNVRFCGLIKSICFNIGLDNGEAEECINDTLFSVWLTVPPQKPQFLISYVSKIARRKAIDFLRHKTAEKRSAEIDSLYSELCECISDKNTIENDFDEKELTVFMNRWLKSLDKNSRIIFVKRYFYSKPIDEISSEINMSYSNVATKLHRLRKKLKSALKKEGI